MTFLLTPRVFDVDEIPGGDVPSHGNVIRRKIEEKNLKRVRVLRRRLKELRGEISEEPEAIELEGNNEVIASFEPIIRERMKVALYEKLLGALKEELSMLETAQIEEEKLKQILAEVIDEELALAVVML